MSLLHIKNFILISLRLHTPTSSYVYEEDNKVRNKAAYASDFAVAIIARNGNVAFLLLQSKFSESSTKYNYARTFWRQLHTIKVLSVVCEMPRISWCFIFNEATIITSIQNWNVNNPFSQQIQNLDIFHCTYTSY